MGNEVARTKNATDKNTSHEEETIEYGYEQSGFIRLMRLIFSVIVICLISGITQQYGELWNNAFGRGTYKFIIFMDKIMGLLPIFAMIITFSYIVYRTFYGGFLKSVGLAFITITVSALLNLFFYDDVVLHNGVFMVMNKVCSSPNFCEPQLITPPLYGLFLYSSLFALLETATNFEFAQASIGIVSLIIAIIVFCLFYKDAWYYLDVCLGLCANAGVKKKLRALVEWLKREIRVHVASTGMHGINNRDITDHLKQPEFDESNDEDAMDFDDAGDTEEESYSYRPINNNPHSPITDKLLELGLNCEMSEICEGHRIKRLYLKVPPEQKVSAFYRSIADLRLTFNSHQVSIGEDAARGELFIDIDKPKNEWENVEFVDIISTPEFKKCRLGVALGFNVVKQPIVFEVDGMKHTLIAGKTGSGKSNIMHLLICSLLTKYRAIEIDLIDPRHVVASKYTKCLGMRAITTDARKGIILVKNAIKLMRERDVQLSSQNCSDIGEWNKRFPKQAMKYRFLCIEEISALLGVLPTPALKEKFKSLLKDIAIGGRKGGVFLIASIQYPKKEILGSELVANFSTKIGGLLEDATESKVVFGDAKKYPAHHLQGQGDFLIKHDGIPPQRIVAAYLNDSTIDKITTTYHRPPATVRKLKVA